MPYPKNVETALLVEKTIRDNGAIPATIGIIEGECIVGLSAEEIELFGKTYNVNLIINKYTNNNRLYLGLEDADN